MKYLNLNLHNNSSEIPINNGHTRKEPKEQKRKEKDEDDKCSKFYEKIKKLDEKFL